MTEDVGTRGRTALEVRGLGKRYRAVKALDDCTFTLPAGGVIALVGANGAGKSTLMSAVPNDMALSGGNGSFVDTAGHVDAYAKPMGECAMTRVDSAFVSCLRQRGMVGMVGIQHSYQPASRMGTFHLIENGLNLTLMLIALAVTWWYVRRARTTT